jgi:Family of unknown function (DUF6062)
MIPLMRTKPDACPICTFVGRRMRAYIDTVFYEQITDVQVRATIREAGGFCRYHAQRVSDQRDALGTALVMYDLLVNELRSLRSADGRAGLPAWGRFLSANKRAERAPCPFCEAEREMDEIAVDSLLQSVGEDPSFRDAFTASDGLCIPHFGLAFARRKDDSAWETVTAVQDRGLDALAQKLDALARSFDHNLRGSIPDVDTASWRRALAITSGKYD